MTSHGTGEVAVRSNGAETAIAAPGLEGSVHVDLDGDEPTVRAPASASVELHQGRAEVAPDGGTRVPRSEVNARGFALEGSMEKRVAYLSAALFAGGGWFASSGQLLATLLTFLGAIATGAIARRSFRSGRA